jgi:hypothetical protein
MGQFERQAALAAIRPLRLPAYGRELLELRRRGLVPDPPEVRVSIDLWDWAKTRTRVVISPDSDPANLDFSFLSGLDVIVGWFPRITTLERRDAAIRSILRALPQRLLLFGYGTAATVTWIKSVGLGVELEEFK